MTPHRFTARIPAPMFEQLETLAEQERRTTNGQLVTLLRGALSGTPPQPAPTAPDHTQELVDTLRRWVSDSEALRGQYEDLDDAVRQTQALLAKMGEKS